MGLLITLLGIITAYRFLSGSGMLCFLTLILIIFQLASLLILYKGKDSNRSKKRMPIVINIIASFALMLFFIMSFTVVGWSQQPFLFHALISILLSLYGVTDNSIVFASVSLNPNHLLNTYKTVSEIYEYARWP